MGHWPFTILNHIETIKFADRDCAILIKSGLKPVGSETKFITPPVAQLQVGYVTYPENGEVQRHRHKPIKRDFCGTGEVLLLLRGLCTVDFYDDNNLLIGSKELLPNDVLIMGNIAHGFRMHEDTVFLEIKQGPYMGVDEKERF